MVEVQIFTTRKFYIFLTNLKSIQPIERQLDFTMASMEMMIKSYQIGTRRLAASVQWKAALWEKDSIEPAMLRYSSEN